MMSCGLKPTSSTSSVYARMQMRTFSLDVAAWPSSSNAITTTAAPWRLTICACLQELLLAPLSEIELTMHLPWQHLSPASTIVELATSRS